jgi:hypothetical protein
MACPSVEAFKGASSTASWTSSDRKAVEKPGKSGNSRWFAFADKTLI